MSSARARRLCAMAAGATALAALTVVTPHGTTAVAAPAGSPHLPDLQTIIPTDSFSVVNGADGREFRYTHLIFNAGAGPLQIQPFYRATAGSYLGRQEVVTHDGADAWSVVRTKRVADAFVYHAEHGHFHFPLASFGLYRVAPGGGFGAPVTMSPKVGFCIADSYIYDTTLEHAGAGHDLWGSCEAPTTKRGISVGGADEYDYRDPGQSVPLTGVSDGTYWFRALSDPHNDFVESDESNNEMDVKVTIDGGTVVAGETREPDTTPCTARLASPSEGGTRRGVVLLTARTSVGSPARVRYLVDGRVVGRSTGPAPYAVRWRSTGVVDGGHWLAAQVTTRRGRVCTSPVVALTVDNAHGPDHTGPRVRFTDPAAGSTVGGRVAVAVSAADTSGVARVRFLVDGTALGRPRLRPPYTVVWNSRRVRPGRHVLAARATDRRGNVTVRRLGVRVRYVPPPKRVRVDGSVVARGTGTLTAGGLSTTGKDRLLVAFVSYDGPQEAGGQAATVSGAGLAWRLQKRSNSQPGVSEIWSARAPGRLNGRAVKAVPQGDGFDGMLSVVAFRNAARVGVAAAAGATSGAPSFYVPAVQEGSWVWAAGNDWDGAVTRVPVAGQRLRRQWLDDAAGDTFWVQALNRPTTVHRLVTVADTAPTDHRWNYVGAEVVARH